MSSPSSIVAFDHVGFAYPSAGKTPPRVILHDVSLDIPHGKVTAIMGASGGGKTTLLRMIGGQIQAQHGRVLLNGTDMADMRQEQLYEARKGIGMLFQFGALFSDMSVFDNVAFPLRHNTRLSESLIHDMVLLMLNAVGLRGARDLYPSALSGGMARRVALARAIALSPSLLLYDEPFAGLDPVSLHAIALLIRQLNNALGVTSVLVSHDLQATLEIADHVVLLADGRVATQGTPEVVLQNTEPAVRQFFHAQSDSSALLHYPAPSLASDFLKQQTASAKAVATGPSS